MSRFFRAELILPLTIVGAAVMLGVSDFMITFEFTPPGGEPLRAQSAADQHGYALLVLAIVTVATMLTAVASGLRAVAMATAAFGVTALLLFLVIDLPDAGKLGDLEDPVFSLVNARAEPQVGFWLEAVGSVVLGLASVAFATLRSDQLRAPIEAFTRRRTRRVASEKSEPTPDPAARRRLFSRRQKPFGFEAGDHKSKRSLPTWLRRTRNNGN